MSLIGTKLGPYEITAAVGAGGMGEVYRANDTRLGRTVAIKVLPAHLSEDPERRQRFEREARTISSLTHPNICTLYDIGREGDTDYLVMEFLEGETLADRLARGLLSLEEAARVSIQIASALDNAHRHGVVHRDLKPGNIMLTKSGVKLLDFGLAKLAQPAPGTASWSLTALPTEAIGDKPLTAEGAILGTFQYMAPEQLEGKDVDARTDIFAFGAIIYEMAAGRRAFEGSSQASLIAAILKETPPPIARLQPMSPPALDRLVNGCLAKDPDERIQSAHDVRLQLEWIADGGSEAGLPSTALPTRRVSNWFWPLASAALLVIVIVMAVVTTRRFPAAAKPTYLELSLPRSGDVSMFTFPVISPDGRHLVTVADKVDGTTQLWIRSMESGRGRFLVGTENARLPFWSPDGRYVGFVAGESLKKIRASGGPPQTLCPGDSYFLGATWGTTNTIVFSGGESGALLQIPDSGGETMAATEIEPPEESHFWPSFFPDGRHFVFLADAQQAENHYLKIGEIGSTESTALMNAISNFLVVAPDVVLFCRAGTLLAQRVDVEERKLVGESVVLAENLVPILAHYYEFTASETMLAYRSTSPLTQMKWVDRSGRELESVGKLGRIWGAVLSPDQTRISYQTVDAEGRAEDIWIQDLSRDAATRLTNDPGSDRDMLWTPDGQNIIFGSSREGKWNFYSKSTMTDSGASRIAEDSKGIPLAVSPDGRYLLVTLFEAETVLWAIPLTADQEAVLLGDAYAESGAFSPDGNWIAITADKGDRNEIHVHSFPEPHTRLQVSMAGGYLPRWSDDGSELFFMAFDQTLMVSEVTMGDRIVFSAPVELFRIPNGIRSFDVSADGQRFLVTANLEDPDTSPLTVILNWKQLLENNE